MLNNKIDTVDPNKYLHISMFNAWKGDSEFGLGAIPNGYYWDSKLNNKFVKGCSFEIYLKYTPDYNFTNKFQSIFFNTNKNNMSTMSFHMPRSIYYDDVDKTKRMEFGYYDISKNRFISYFNRTKFISDKMKYVGDFNNYMIKYNGLYLDSDPTFTTLGELISYVGKNHSYYSSSGIDMVVFRWFLKFNDYLSGINQRFVYRFVVGRDTKYNGGGEI